MFFRGDDEDGGNLNRGSQVEDGGLGCLEAQIFALCITEGNGARVVARAEVGGVLGASGTSLCGERDKKRDEEKEFHGCLEFLFEGTR